MAKRQLAVGRSAEAGEEGWAAKVTTLLSKIKEEEAVPKLSAEALEQLRAEVAGQADKVKQLKEVRSTLVPFFRPSIAPCQ